MASRGKGSSTHSPSAPTRTTTNNSAESQSFLSRKKKEIVKRSMALFSQGFDRCLDNSVSYSASGASSAVAAGGGGLAAAAGRRRVKRGREEEEDCDGKGEGGGGCVKGAVVKKKRGNPAVEKKVEKKKGGEGGKKFACPFCRHDPGRYRNVKTCCGPGWDDVHRVKEHVYRRHSLKNFCPRCFEHFDKPEALKSHQRQDVPCEVREQESDVISDEQEKLLRARAKAHMSEEDKWDEMYRAIFPGEKVPSPYYESETDPSATSAKSRFQSLDECKDFIRAEVTRLVRLTIEQYVNTLFEEAQIKVNQKVFEIAGDIETKVLRTFQFQEEQASALSSSSTAAAPAPVLGLASQSEPSPPPSPELSKVSQLFEGLKEDAFGNEICGNLHFDLEAMLAQGQWNGCDNLSADSAYFTSSLSGGQGSFGVEYPTQY